MRPVPDVRFISRKRVSEQGISTDPAKTDKVMNLSIQTNLTHVNSFLGLCSFYKNPTDYYIDIPRPLNEPSKADRMFKWTENCQTAFNQLKTLLTTAPVLAYPDLEKTFFLDTYASNYAISEVLSQVKEGEKRVVAYGSKTLSETAEQLYDLERATGHCVLLSILQAFFVGKEV